MLTPGSIVLGRYRILQPLGQGGMARVYLAEDSRLGGRYVALKEMDPALLAPSEQQWAITAFQQEAQVLARLSHHGVARVTDFFQENNFWYLVMEYVQGETLEAALRRNSRGFVESQVLFWVSQLADVLDYLHQQLPPIIFRDLKPANIMVQADGTLKLIDFGIARFFKPGQGHDTVTLGTPGYAAPEQYGRGQTDVRSDVYSLGVLTHQLLTGYDPSLSPMYLPPVQQLNPAVSNRAAAAINQAIHVAPELRFRSVKAFAAALNAPGSGEAAPIWPRFVAWFLAQPTAVRAAIGLIPIALFILLGWSLSRAVGTGGATTTPTPLSTTIADVTETATIETEFDEESASESEETITEAEPASEGETAGPETAPDATSTREPSPTPTPTPTITPTPTPTNTHPPTNTPTPITPSPTPFPTACAIAVGSSFSNSYQSVSNSIGCPSAAARNVQTAQETFQSGLMLWRQDNDKIYAIYNNNSWARYDDLWREGDPSFSCGVQSSPPTPQRGFGKIWCTYSAVQQGLGNATDGEWAETRTLQEFSNGWMAMINGRVYIFFYNGTWRN
jgi:serine/threonine protein kinase